MLSANLKLDTSIYRCIQNNKLALILGISITFATQTWLALFYDWPEIAFGAPYQHYSYAIVHAAPGRALFVYIVESVGIVAAFLMIMFYAIRISSSEPRYKVAADIGKKSPAWARVALITSFLTIIFLAHIIESKESADGTKALWAPADNPFKAIMYGLSPFFLALIMKFWLAEERALKNANASHNQRE